MGIPTRVFELEANGLRRGKDLREWRNHKRSLTGLREEDGESGIAEVGAELAESGLIGTRALTGQLLWYDEQPQREFVVSYLPAAGVSDITCKLFISAFLRMFSRDS